MRHNRRLAVALLTAAAFTPLSAHLPTVVELKTLSREDVLNQQLYDVEQATLGMAKVQAVGVQHQMQAVLTDTEWNTVGEMLAELEVATQARKVFDETLKLKPRLKALLDTLPKERARLLERKAITGVFPSEELDAYNKLAREYEALVSDPEMSLSLRANFHTFGAMNDKIAAQRSAIRKLGGTLPEEAELVNFQLRYLKGPANPAVDKFGLAKSRSEIRLMAAQIVVTLILVVAAVLYLNSQSPDDNGEGSRSSHTEEMKAAIVKGSSSAAALMKEGCTELHLSAAKVEGVSQGEMSVKQYYALLSELSPVYHEGYQVASRAAAETLGRQLITSWGGATAAPLSPVIPDGATDAEKHKLELAYAEAHEKWAVNEFMKPIHSQFQFAQQYHEDIHEAAFVHMRNSTELSFAADSDHFNKAYTAMYARYNILPECSPYVHEDKVTTAWFKEGRAKHAVLFANSTAALDLHFASCQNGLVWS